MSFLGFLGDIMDQITPSPLDPSQMDPGIVVKIPPYDKADLSEQSVTNWMEGNWPHLKAALSDDEVSSLIGDCWEQIDRAYAPYGGYSKGAESTIDRVFDAYYERAVTYLNTGQDPWKKPSVMAPGMMPKWARYGVWVGLVGGSAAVVHRLWTGEWAWE